MAKPIKIRINVVRVLKQHLDVAESGKYLNLVAFENKKGPDKYGNTHFVCQEISREAKERGEMGPILGNLKVPDQPAYVRPPPRTEAARVAATHEEPPQSDLTEEDIPF